MKLADAFHKQGDKWVAELSDLQDFTGRLCLQSGKEYASLDAFMRACTPHYTDDLDHELTHWTFMGDKVTIFND
jgi:hypothetical protein